VGDGDVVRILCLTTRAIYGAWFADGAIDSRALVEEAIRLAAGTGSPSLIGLCTWFKGLIIERRDPNAALEFFRTAMATVAPLGHRHHVNLGCRVWIHVAAAQGDDLDLALSTARDVLEASRNDVVVQVMLQTMRTSALALVRAGDPRTAALILGSVEASGYLGPGTQAIYDRTIAMLADELGAEAIRLRSAGSSLSLRTAAAMAIEALDSCLARRAAG
jgi:hypothetical protein